MSEETPAAKLSQMLVMTPQLQMAIRMLAMPARELGTLVDRLRADHPGCIADVDPGSPDLGDQLDEELRRDDPDAPAFEFLVEPPLPVIGDELADVWVFGNPPRVRANRAAIPRFVLATGASPDGVREAKWLARAIRQRARTCEKVVAALVERRPQLAVATDPATLAPVSPRELAEAVGMHESTITRVASACRFQNLHGVFAITLVGARRTARKRSKR